MVVEERGTFNVGEWAERSLKIDDEYIRRFADLTQDTNPIHLDEAFALESWFGGRIAHGMIAANLISAVLGSMLPGPGSIYFSQNLEFRAPVRPGDTVTARAMITRWYPKKGRVILSTEVRNQENVVVVTGKAILIMSSFLRRR